MSIEDVKFKTDAPTIERIIMETIADNGYIPVKNPEAGEITYSFE